MASWNQLLQEFEALPDDATRSRHLVDSQIKSLKAIGDLRGGRNVLFYASAFLQKPEQGGAPTSITAEDINGVMSTIMGMDWKQGLTFLLHTPGGSPNAAETIIAYLRNKFDYIEVIVPAYAMSAGTVISLAADRIIMGRQSQLGPIDPQMLVNGRYASAQAIVDQFARARTDILKNNAAALAWAPILQMSGPALLQEARNALAYGEQIAAEWLAKCQFGAQSDAKKKARRVAHYFNNARRHKSHGRRIDRDEARSVGLNVEDLESSQDLQEAVLTAYHLATITFEKGPATKFLISSPGKMWVKNQPMPPPRNP